MKVKLTYFFGPGSCRGLFNQEAEYELKGKPKPGQFEVETLWDEIEPLLEKRELPGLMKGHDPMYVLVDFQDGQRRPRLLFLDEKTDEK